MIFSATIDIFFRFLLRHDDLDDITLPYCSRRQPICRERACFVFHIDAAAADAATLHFRRDFR